MKARLAELFRSKTRDEWCETMERTDVCFAPVLNPPHAGQPGLLKASTSQPSAQNADLSLAEGLVHQLSVGLVES